MNNFKSILVTPDSKIEQLVKEVINFGAQEIVLEVSETATLLNNEINLRMLKFYAEEEAKELIIKAADPQLLSLAQRIGISTLRESDLTTAESSRDLYTSYQKGAQETAAVPEVEPKSRSLRQRHRRSSYLLPMTGITIFTLALASWWFLQPRVIVLVYPKEQQLSFATPAVINTEVSADNIIAGKLAAKLLEKTAQTSVQVLASGRRLVGVTAATGKITLINSGEQPVVIPKGSTLVGKEGIRFLTESDVLAPKAVPQYDSGIRVGTRWGRAEVTILATKKGTVGNQPAKSITTLEGKQYPALQVINFSPTRNGMDKKVPIVTLEDVKRGEAEARQQMELIGPDEVLQLVGRDYVLVPNLVNLEVLRINNSPEIGAEGEMVQINLEYRVSTMSPTQTGVQKLLFSRLDKQTPENFQAKSGKIELIAAKVVSSSASQAQIEFHGKGWVQGVLNRAKIRELIKGREIAEAREALLAQDEIRDFRIRFKDESSRLPKFGFQIKIIFPEGAKPR